MLRATPANEAGFTLVEVLLASGLFVVVAFAALETLRQLAGGVALLAQRSDARAKLAFAAGMLRSDAISAAAVWKPATACGDALALMQRDAAGTAFLLYLRRGEALVRLRGPAPIDACNTALPAETLVARTAGFRVEAVAVSGPMLIPSGSVEVAADAHVRDVDGTPIRGGNGVVEVTIDAEPVVTVVDLVAENRPSGATVALTYACAARCAANGPFPEIRGGDYATCVQDFDFQNGPAYYVPATIAARSIGGGAQQLRVTSYWVTGAYTFAFAGLDATTARRTWTPAIWPPGGALVDDAYPVDYGTNAVAALPPGRIASDLGAATAYAAELAACAALNGDVLFRR